AKGVGSRIGQVLDQPHRVVAHVAEDAGCHGWQVLWQGDGGAGEKGAKRGQSRQRLALEGIRMRLRVRIDLGRLAEGAPDEVWLQPDNGVAATNGAALHRLEKEAHRRV